MFRFVCICLPLFYQYRNAMHLNKHFKWEHMFNYQLFWKNWTGNIHTLTHIYSPSHLQFTSTRHTHIHTLTNNQSKQINMCILIVLNVRKIRDSLNFSIDSLALANTFFINLILFHKESFTSLSLSFMCVACNTSPYKRTACRFVFPFRTDYDSLLFVSIFSVTLLCCLPESRLTLWLSKAVVDTAAGLIVLLIKSKSFENASGFCVHIKPIAQHNVLVLVVKFQFSADAV